MNGQSRQTPSPTTTLRSLGQALQNGALQTPGRQTPAPNVASRTAQADLHGVLAARDLEVALLRQQLSQLTADFKFNLKLLEERDLELERMEAVMSGLKESAAAKELALAETRRLLAEKDTALREKESRAAVLEERQRQTMDLCERQVAEARASRDDEVAKCEAKCDGLEQQLRQRMATVEGIAAREKADIIAGYEKQISGALAAERESRQAAQQARQEDELVRSQLQRAEAKVAEQELAMQRMVTQFEGALQALQQLEGQHSALASESAAAERARTGRIQQLEMEVDALRASNAALQAEQDSLASSLTQQLQERERQLAEVKQRYHTSSLDNADLADTIIKLKQELQQAKDQAQQAEDELQSVRGRCSQAQAALDRECTAHAQTQGLLETTRLCLEAAKRDGRAQAQEAVQLREGVAVLEAQCSDAAQALEAAHAKLRAADERLHLLGEQMEQERARHARSLASQEEQLVAQAAHAVAAVQDEKAALQDALEQANRQLQQSYHDMETLRLQLDHMRLAPPPPSPSAVAAAAAADPALRLGGAGSALRRGAGLEGLGGRGSPAAPAPAHSTGSSGQHSGHSFLLSARHLGWAASSGMGGQTAGAAAGQLGAGRYPDALPDSSFEAEAASSVSGDVFSDLADANDGLDSARGMEQQGMGMGRQHPTSRFAPSASAGRRALQGPGPGKQSAASLYQQQLHQHIDSLTSKLGSFERAVERARHAGSQAASQVVQSAEELPQALQRRQVEVTEDVLKKKLARERDNFLKERQRLDRELAEKDRLLQQRDRELQQLQKDREAEALRQRQAELQQKEQELKQLAQQLEQQQQQVAGSAPASVAGSVPASPALQQAATGEGRYSALAAAPAAASVAATALSEPHPPQPQKQPPGAYHWPQLAGAFPSKPDSSMAAMTAPSGASAHHQQQWPAAQPTGASLPQPAAVPSLRCNTLLGTQPVPTAGAGSLRSSLAASRLGSGSLGVPVQRLASGTGPRLSTESLYTPRGEGSSTQALSAGQPPALGPHTSLGSARSSPAAGLAGAPTGGRPGLAAQGVAGEAEDPLAKARRQVMLAKEYLKSVAEMGGKLSRSGAAD